MKSFSEKENEVQSNQESDQTYTKVEKLMNDTFSKYLQNLIEHANITELGVVE